MHPNEHLAVTMDTMRTEADFELWRRTAEAQYDITPFIRNADITDQKIQEKTAAVAAVEAEVESLRNGENPLKVKQARLKLLVDYMGKIARAVKFEGNRLHREYEPHAQLSALELDEQVQTHNETMEVLHSIIDGTDTDKVSDIDELRLEAGGTGLRAQARQFTDVSRWLDSHGGHQVLEAKAAQSDSVSSLLETEGGVDALKKKVARVDALATLMKDYDTKGLEEKAAIADAIAALFKD
ncbi:hypothetical protein BKA58DRAFT_91766 [Alternaria rosae]|uniref:uncharacterized protein n=1 Tax=Alternaria rosae TaxID=1187941 RepID=UPI001E8E2E5C|nr:uncharacterized protein BKA58DRAFT_91766 [Alternaria rosae]KAH6878254.1 hypothetical protein BKA58DRAFT_91766 [Alternaria rosae]